MEFPSPSLDFFTIFPFETSSCCLHWGDKGVCKAAFCPEHPNSSSVSRRLSSFPEALWKLGYGVRRFWKKDRKCREQREQTDNIKEKWDGSVGRRVPYAPEEEEEFRKE